MAVPFSLASLREEIINDPASLGYAPLVVAQDYQGIAVVINLPRSGGGYKQRKDTIPIADIIETIPFSEYNSASAGAKAWLGLFFTVPDARLLKDDGVTDTVIFANLKACFGAGTASRAALNALAQREGSRGEVVWGNGFSVGTTDIANALAS